MIYPDCLANVVMVKKSNGNWHMCVDFINLNKACPKKKFPLLKIDRLVDSITGFEYLTSLDANYRYNQIPIYPNDE